MAEIKNSQKKKKSSDDQNIDIKTMDDVEEKETFSSTNLDDTLHDEHTDIDTEKKKHEKDNYKNKKMKNTKLKDANIDNEEKDDHHHITDKKVSKSSDLIHSFDKNDISKNTFDKEEFINNLDKDKKYSSFKKGNVVNKKVSIKNEPSINIYEDHKIYDDENISNNIDNMENNQDEIYNLRQGKNYHQ